MLVGPTRTDTVSDRILFPACVSVLEEAVRPLHYKEITTRALARLGLNVEDVNLTKVKEDVRERLLEAGRLGTFYVPKPYCLGGLQKWLDSSQRPLFQEDFRHETVRIEGNAQAGFLGSFEVLMRRPFMLAKAEGEDPILKARRDWTDADWRKMRKISERHAKGYTIEAHVIEWHRSRWPDLILDAENAGEYTKPCGHDFRIYHGSRPLKVDITGAGYQGEYGKSVHGKPRADYHLCCTLDHREGCVWFEGFISGKDFGEWIGPEQLMSPLIYVVYLDCLAAGLPYRVLRSCAESANKRGAA